MGFIVFDFLFSCLNASSCGFECIGHAVRCADRDIFIISVGNVILLLGLYTYILFYIQIKNFKTSYSMSIMTGRDREVYMERFGQWDAVVLNYIEVLCCVECRVKPGIPM